MHNNSASRAAELKSRGLTDEKVIADLIASEGTTPLPTRLPNEMYDKVNYLCRKYMDRIAHFAVDYDFIIDEQTFKTVIICFLEKTPVFHSAFRAHPVKPYWQVCDYKIDDALTSFEAEDIESETDKFHSQSIPASSNIQIKFALIYHGGKTRVAMLWNHMCADGSGFIRFYSDICRNYSAYVSEKISPLDFACGSRSYKEVYRDFSPDEQKQAKKLLANHSAHCKYTLPFTPESNDDFTVIVRRKPDFEIFNAARKAAKALGASVNDLIAAAYIDAIYEITGCPENEEIAISCAVDLRRHIKDLSRIGITNHTTFMKCSVPKRGENIMQTLQEVARCNAENKADKFLGLHGLPLLNFAYSSMVYAQAELVVGLFYNNAALSVSTMSNLDLKLFSLDEHKPIDAYVIGAVKRKPCAAVNIVSLSGQPVLSMCIRGNKKDREIIEHTFDLIEDRFKLIADKALT